MAKSSFLWDVFLSHGRAQKPLVRALVQQWRQLGLSVFLDEDSIQPGEDVIAALDRACEKSRHTVLLITPEAIASKWVDQEIKRAVYVDPTAMERRLIPVLLQPVDMSEIPLSVRKLNRTDLTDATTRRQQYHHLLTSLGITARPLPDLPVVEADRPGLAASALKPPLLETGAMPPDSPYYIERQVDRKIHELLETPGATVTVKGYRQSGKSSVLARLHARAIESGRACCILDFQGLDAEMFRSTKEFFPALAQNIADGLEVDVDSGADWSVRRGAKQNLRIFLEKHILALLDRPVLLLFDEADLAFPYPEVREELFSTLRFWHNLRANKLNLKTWKRVGLVVAHSTEPGLWISALNQSPFNVAHEFTLDDFKAKEVGGLDVSYGHKLRGEAEGNALMELVGGHPHLVRLALYTMATEPCSFAVLEAAAVNEDGPFATHLGHMLNILYNDDSLLRAVRKILKYGKCDDERIFHRLWSVGLIRGETRHKVWLRYKIYDRYFRKKLL
jgi:hypothetical protein